MKLQKLISNILILITLLNSALQTAPVEAESFSQPRSTSGDFVWAKDAGGATNDQGYGVATDSNSNLYTTGSYGVRRYKTHWRASYRQVGINFGFM